MSDQFFINFLLIVSLLGNLLFYFLYRNLNKKWVSENENFLKEVSNYGDKIVKLNTKINQLNNDLEDCKNRRD